MGDKERFEVTNSGSFMDSIGDLPECNNDEDAAVMGVSIGEWYRIKDTYYDEYGNRTLKGLLKQRLQ